jgi:hypothetical protein
MKNERITVYHGQLRRGGWSLAADVYGEPHPYDDEKMAGFATDELFAAVTAVRADVRRVQSLFGLDARWEGDLEYIDPSGSQRRIHATVVVNDVNILSMVRVEAVIESRDGGDVQEHHGQIIVVPHQRLPLATPRRVSKQIRELPERVRRYLLGRLPRYRADSARALAFILPVAGKPEAAQTGPIYGFNLMLIRAVLQWTADRDLAGKGIRWRLVRPKAA